MSSAKVSEKQSILDLSVAKCGSIEAAYDMALLNGKSITDTPAVGEVISLPSVKDKDIANHFKAKGINPATLWSRSLTPIEFGLLYNWYAVNDPRGILPIGWRVPTLAEFLELLTWLGSGNDYGGLKTTGFEYWDPPNTGATNIYKFNAKAAGYRNETDGSFDFRKRGFVGWLSDVDPNNPLIYALCFDMHFESSSPSWGSNAFKRGLSVRGIKNDSIDPKTVTDIDGNVYPTVKIGNQVWMAENLVVTRYRNGDPIPEVVRNQDWLNTSSGARCQYVNYGLLYNWHVAENSAAKGLLMDAGWVVPTNTQLQGLAVYYLGQSVAGGKMKGLRTEPDSDPCWKLPNAGASDVHGLSIYGTGCRDDVGAFTYKQELAYLWCGNQLSEMEAYFISLSFQNDDLTIQYSAKTFGQAIRLMKPWQIGDPVPTEVTDYDGNKYGVVRIGQQLWMTSNLKTTHYADGEAIPEVTDGEAWAALTTHARCAYNNDTTNI